MTLSYIISGVERKKNHKEKPTTGIKINKLLARKRGVVAH